ncbi:hypothetical protein [Catellatospora bangladeshensis]|uniref:Uncharacterized protein n=1 Tax=Catellatospora bangladeshensis TaxID=310355 RepID=A0A8J3NKJ7_9ACTN|nr:hypothetical protein [Catellatospora bangladeshensis]GIF84117.1 hypothetical protein Cba03nite_54660 [Catellatospora bangladeshensis]
MTTHFASIGVDLAREGLSRFTTSVVSAAVAVPINRRHCDHVWTDPSGARVVARSRWGRVHQVQPSLAGGAVAVPCGSIRLIDDRTAVMDLLDDTDGDLICPVAVHLEDHSVLHVAGGWLARGQIVLSALAETASSAPDRPPEPAADIPLDLGLVCDGLVRPAHAPATWTPSPRTELRGTVRAAELRTNGLTGDSFHWLRLHVRPGLELDVAAPATALPAVPAPGTRLHARAVLTGSLGLQPGTLPRPRRAKHLRRLRRRDEQ